MENIRGNEATEIERRIFSFRDQAASKFSTEPPKDTLNRTQYIKPTQCLAHIVNVHLWIGLFP